MRKKPLAPDKIIAKAADQYRNANGYFPHQGDTGFEPEHKGIKLSWTTTLRRLVSERGKTLSVILEENGYAGIKIPLPSNEDIAVAMHLYAKNTQPIGNLPGSKAYGLEPDKRLSWSRTIRRLKTERGLTPTELMKTQGFYQKLRVLRRNSKRHENTNVTNSKKPKRHKKAFEKIVAKDVFNGVVRFIHAKKALPDVNDKTHFIASRSASSIAKAFKTGNIIRLDEIPGFCNSHDKIKPLFEEFMLQSGLAIQGEGKTLKIPKKIPCLITKATHRRTQPIDLPEAVAA